MTDEQQNTKEWKESECYAINSSNCSLITVTINNMPFKMQLDTGASLSLITKKLLDSVGKTAFN
jgi:hypothetical protein